ncbi:MAG: sugar phosphate isomerase [Phycisphaerae bacterium]|nr:sugar phosphate isomerase [Phycisphaerae bacterium]
MADRVFDSAAFRTLVAAMAQTLRAGGKIVFSGCGATGRLSIQLEAGWREYCQNARAASIRRMENQVFSIMTGGDYALVRSVESFEDYMEFGRQQVRELGLGNRDTLVAITEGGETSSVIGTCWEALERRAGVFLLFNNPTDVLRRHVQRSREIIEHPEVTVLDLYCGPMAIAGSTRMQATTSELLVAGAALECAICKLRGHEAVKYPALFSALLDDLANNAGILADYAQFEANLYAKNGLVTYFADAFMIDIFTDTTERAPTFMTPPFRRADDQVSPVSWAFAKNPTLPTPDAWRNVLRRAPRCLDWTPELYERMGAAPTIIDHPPALTASDLETFHIGAEDDPSRRCRSPHAAVAVLVGSEVGKLDETTAFGAGFSMRSRAFNYRKTLLVGAVAPLAFSVEVGLPDSPTRLWHHLAVKLTLNTVSTASMAMRGRVEGNWMTHVEATNKKLIDRSICLVSELKGLSYAEACLAVFEAMDRIAASGMRQSAAQVACELLQQEPGIGDLAK